MHTDLSICLKIVIKAFANFYAYHPMTQQNANHLTPFSDGNNLADFWSTKTD
jgi:hypothetical protein